MRGRAAPPHPRIYRVPPVPVDLIKSVGSDIYTTSESDASLCKACATRVNVEDSVANLMCLPVEKPDGILAALSR